MKMWCNFFAPIDTSVSTDAVHSEDTRSAARDWASGGWELDVQ